MKNWITTGLGLFIVVATIGTAADELVLKPVKIAPIVIEAESMSRPVGNEK